LIKKARIFEKSRELAAKKEMYQNKCGNTGYVDTLSFAASVNNAVEMSAI